MKSLDSLTEVEKAGRAVFHPNFANGGSLFFMNSNYLITSEIVDAGSMDYEASNRRKES